MKCRPNKIPHPQCPEKHVHLCQKLHGTPHSDVSGSKITENKKYVFAAKMIRACQKYQKSHSELIVQREFCVFVISTPAAEEDSSV